VTGRKERARRLAAIWLFVTVGGAHAQALPDEAVGVQEDPCADLAPMPAGADIAVRAEWQKRRLLQDFAGLCHYRDENARLGPGGGERVVFFGDSITELWRRYDADFFTGGTVNRGISGQTTAQMMVRFHHDVVALRPRVVHILAGTNDLAGNTGPTSLAWIEANIRGMVELARAHRIAVVLAAVPPATWFNWRPSIRPAGQIKALNARIEAYARSADLVFVDYGRALGDGGGGIKPALTTDGVHPNAAGYARMRPLAESAIGEALRRR
jgi:acyl-CoA thioesterase I